MLLKDHIRSKLGGSLSADEAKQYAFLLFCTLNCIPRELRSHKWDRGLIAAEFSGLVRAELIRGSSDEMRESWYWDKLITSFLREPKECEIQLQERLFEQARSSPFFPADQ